MAFLLTEYELIKGCQQGDTGCQKHLYEKYKDAMFTLCVRLSPSYADAQDVFQEGFIDVFSNIKSFRGEATVGVWMKTIFSRRAYHTYKKAIWSTIDSLDENDLVEWGDSIDVELLELAMRKLPDGFRIVLVLIEIEGYKHREVAEMLGISEGTSKSQLFHAKKRLKELLISLQK